MVWPTLGSRTAKEQNRTMYNRVKLSQHETVIAVIAVVIVVNLF